MEGKNATCYPGFEDQLKGAKFKAVPVVTDGNITTSRGMGTSILLGLELVKLLKDEETSKKLAEAYEKVMQPLCKKLDMPKTALDVLMFLANNPEFNTAGDVCRYRNIKAALVSFHVEKLVEAGFVERQAVKGDRRKSTICLF